MNSKKEVFSISLVSIMLFLFIEAFFNVLVNINAYIFMNLSNIVDLVPSLLILISSLILIFYGFISGKLKRRYKAHFLLYLIIGCRICTQFVVIPSIIFIINFLMLFLVMIFFAGFILLMRKNVMDILDFIGSLLFGLGIHFLLIMLGLSSNLTSDFHKIIPIFIIIGILIYLNNKLFFPAKIQKVFASFENNKEELSKSPLPLIHYVIIAILFLFSMMYIFNPMALSAYDPINLFLNGLDLSSGVTWFSYGFTYYILVILSTAIISYILISKYLFNLDQKKMKFILVLSISLTCLLTWFAQIIIENDLTLISTIYNSFMVITGVFSILLYISFLFRHYDFGSPRRVTIGIFIFFISVLFFILLHVEILWDNYFSLFSHLTIQITSATLILGYIEFFLKKDIKLTSIDLKFIIHSKPIVYFLLSILILYVAFLGILVQTRKVETPQGLSLNFMVWNIHNGIGDDDIFNLDRIIREIKDKNPDVIGLNEVDLGALKTSFIDLPAYFAHRLNMYYYYGYTFYKHYGNVLLSKYPILNAKIIPLPSVVQDSEPRSMIRADLNISDSIWTVFITHLSTESDDRVEQVSFIVNEINDESAFEKTLWMGDLNLEPTSFEYSLINTTTPLNFTDSYRILNSDPGYTGHFNENYAPQKRIDYILCSPDLPPISSEVICSVSSDHCALMTQFLLF